VERLRSVFEAPRQLNLSLKMPIPLICTSGPRPTFQSFHFRFKVPIMVFLTIIFTSFLHSLIRVSRRDKIWDFKRILIQTHNFSMKKPSTRCTDTLDQWTFHALPKQRASRSLAYQNAPDTRRNASQTDWKHLNDSLCYETPI